MIARHILAGAVLAAVATGAAAQTRVTYKSAAAGSSYYQMGVQIAEMMDEQSDIQVTVEESQGSVQNVMEVRARGADYVFTTPPGLVAAAQSAAGPFEGRADPAFDEIRALFPIPSLTMHFVMSAETGAQSIEDLAGTTLLLGKGSFGATEGARYLDLFGIADEVQIADVELSNAVPALQNGQIDGFVTAGSYPAPNVVEAAASTDVTILSLTDAQVEQTGRARLVIPAGTYPDQQEDTVTTSLPVVAYTTSQMNEETAYQITKTFWESREAMAESARWWQGVTPELLDNIQTQIHPGAVRYYQEAGIELSEEQM